MSDSYIPSEGENAHITHLKSLGKAETHSCHKPHPWSSTRQWGGNSQLQFPASPRGEKGLDPTSKGELESNTITVGYFNNSLPTMHRSSRQHQEGNTGFEQVKPDLQNIPSNSSRIQAYLILALLHFADSSFLQIESLWQPCIGQVYWRHFSNSICSLHVSVSHFGNSHNISNFFCIIIFVMVICDVWCYCCNCFGALWTAPI